MDCVYAILDRLTSQQAAAAVQTGPVLVLARASTGKTTTLSGTGCLACYASCQQR